VVKKWSLAGSILGGCNCDWGCPCSFDAPPTNGACQGAYAWIVKKGHYGDVKLDGVAFVGAGFHPGAIHLGHGTWVTLVDERASPAQREAIATLRNGDGVGLPFDIFAKVTETRLPTIYAPFQVSLKGIRSSLKVGGGKLFELTISRIKNPVSGDEEEVYLDKPTGFTAKRSELGMSIRMRVNTPGLSYDNSGKYAEFSEFAYSGP